MSEPPGVPSALGIEAVEWIAEGGENLTVRVTGRWRRRRPAWSGQPTLVVEAPGRRYRFPAMPEPPSLSGIGPGMWRISFAVPAALAPELGGRAWLQFGSVAVPLPSAIEPPSTLLDPELEAPEAGSGAPGALGAPPASPESPASSAAGGVEPSTELAEEAARRRAEQAEEQRPEARDHTPDPGGGGEAARLAAEAELHAQRMSAVARTPREPPPPQPSASSALSDAARLALRYELDRHRGAELALESRLLQAEAQLAARVELARRVDGLLVELRRELDGLRAAFAREREARLRAERDAASLRSELEQHRARSRDASAAIAGLREGLDALTAEREAPAGDTASAERGEGQADARSAPGTEAPTAGQSAPAGESAPEVESGATGAAAPADQSAPGSEAAPEGEPGPPESPAGPDEPAPALEADRLNDALARLRERIAPPEETAAGGAAAEPRPHTAALPAPTSEPAGAARNRAWLAPVFRELVRSDPERAGRLIVDLLPAQLAVHDQPVAYDLVLGPERATVRVTARDGRLELRAGQAPRDRGDVDFQIHGDPAALARLLVAGRLRRRFGRRVARVRGRRSGLTALDALVGLKLDLAGLAETGVRLRPRTALVLIAGLIEPAEAARERFVVAYAPAGDGDDDPVYLVVGGGAVEVTGVRPAGRIATTITGSAGAIERALGGARSAQVSVSGEEWPLALLRRWIKHAQSG